MTEEHTYKDLSLIIAEKQKIVDRLTEEKNSLLKTISHDIRAPFNQMFALLQLMELDISDMSPEQKGYIDKMYHAVISGMEMIKNLHDARAIDQGKISILPEKFNLHLLLKQVVRNFNIQARIRNMNIRLKSGNESMEIMSDKILVRKIIENMLSNSVRFSELDSTVKIELVAGKSGAIINISDHGPGIPENELPKIFLKYSKIGNKPTLGESTTGLGMYLSKYFADAIAGELRAENNKSGGLKVTLELPYEIPYSE